MRLSDEGKFDINQKLAYYWSELDSTNKKDIKIKDVLAHRAGLKAWIPFYLRTKDKETDELYTDIYSKTYSGKFCHKVDENLYMSDDYVDVMYQRIYDSKLKTDKKYRYSDLGYYIFYKIVEDLTGESFDKYLEQTFYSPLGANFVCFNPLEKYELSQIVPTENDYKFRKKIVHGYVHDYGAAMLGGVAGHAGLFANANDLAKILQMYLQGGYYGGDKYLNGSTITTFTKKQFKKNRRGLGFDRRGKDGKGPACKATSDNSYGHTGFTGCMVWIDPEYELVYIFLSNRIHPDIENKKINELNVREKVQAMIYEAIIY